MGCKGDTQKVLFPPPLHRDILLQNYHSVIKTKEIVKHFLISSDFQLMSRFLHLSTSIYFHGLFFLYWSRNMTKLTHCILTLLSLSSFLFRDGNPFNGNPLQYSCLGNHMDRGAHWTTVHGVTKESDTTKQLNNSKMFTESLLCAGHCSKYLALINSFKLLDNHMANPF